MDNRKEGMHPESPHLDGDALCGYAEGAMDVSARAAVEDHLRRCAACSRELEAVRGYFLDMASLEPVKAPPGFLAGVHARLPKPSPWKKALSGLWNPRGAPLQIAFLTLLGITAITAYLHQRGGLVSEAPTVLELTEAAPEAPASRATDQQEAAASVPQSAPEDLGAYADKDAAPSLSAKSDAAPPARKKAANGLGLGAGGGGGGSGGRQRAEEEFALSDDAPIAKAKSGPADRKERSTRRGDAFSKSVAAQRPAAAAEPAAPPSGEAVARSAPAPAETDKREARDAVSRTGPLGGFAIRMKTLADTTAMLAGLRNMGAIIEPGGVAGELRYVVSLPSSMLPDMRAYLERHAVSVDEDKPAPVARDENLSVFLRILRVGE